MKPTEGTEKLFDVIEREVRHLWFDVLAWRGLYNERTIPKLNRRTPQIFSLFQFRLYDAHHIRICRLLDPAKARRRDTSSASAPALVAAVRRDGLTDLANEMNAFVKAMRKLAAGVEWNRDRLVAHVDLDARLGEIQPEDPPTFETVEAIARIAADLVNLYAKTIRGATFVFDPASVGIHNFDPVGVDVLIRELELAERYRRENPGHGLPQRARQALKELEHPRD